MKLRSLLALVLTTPFATAFAAVPLRTPQAVIAIPGGAHGIGFDDIGYAPQLGKVLIPAGATGNLVLINPASDALTVIPGIATSQASARDHGEGTTSTVYAAGYLIASDHDPASLVVIDPQSKKVVERTPLASGPDYVRYVASLHEVWVTEPDKQQIQVFRYAVNARPMLRPETVIPIAGGPESLAIDDRRGWAYTNLWTGTTVEIDLAAHTVLAEWPNSCSRSHGLALDETQSLLFVGCGEGKVVTLAPAQDGKLLASAPAGAGIDIISYSPELHHLYVPGARATTLTIFGVTPAGALAPLAIYKTADGAHCVTDDNAGHVFVCDPRGGDILKINDH